MKQVALITGVAGGIGSATARAFADAAWHVVGVEVREVDAVPAVEHLIYADISDPVASQQLFTEVAGDEGRIDALINNAAVHVCKPLLDTTAEEWEL